MKTYSSSFLLGIVLLGMTGTAFANEEKALEVLSEQTQVEKTASKDLLTPNFTYRDTSVNYLNWSQGTEARSAAQNGMYGLTDFVYLELEGGTGWTFIYNFKVGEQKFMLSNRHEFEFTCDAHNF